MTVTLYAGVEPDYLRQDAERKATTALRQGLDFLERKSEDPIEGAVMKITNPLFMYRKLREALQEARKARAFGFNTEVDIRNAAIEYYRDYLDGKYASLLSRFTVKPVKEYLFVSYVGGKGPAGFVLGPLRVLGHRVHPGEIYGAIKGGIKTCSGKLYQKITR